MLDLDSVVPPYTYVNDYGVSRTYQPKWAECGASIKSSVKKALDYITVNNIDKADFQFNDQRIVVRLGDTVESVEAEWFAESDRRLKAWEASPAGIKYAMERARSLARSQRIIDTAMAKLSPKILASDNRTIRWIVSWADAADHIGVRIDSLAIVNSLVSAGYKSGAYVGKADEISTSSTAMARYLIGQVISFMETRMPPHPLLSYWYKEKYLPMLRTKNTKRTLKRKRNKVIHA